MNKRAKSERVKASGIRAINQGTGYDVAGRLKKIAREIDRGEHGEVLDAVVVLRFRKDGSMGIHPRVFGYGTTPEYHFMISRASKWLDE